MEASKSAEPSISFPSSSNSVSWLSSCPTRMSSQNDLLKMQSTRVDIDSLFSAARQEKDGMRRRHEADQGCTEPVLASPNIPVEQNDSQHRRLKSPASIRSLRRDDEESWLPPKRSRARVPIQSGVSHRFACTESPRPSTSSSFEPRSPEVDQMEELIKQPETRPMSQEQLVAEVKGIYAGLVMVESKCIEVDNAQSSTETSTKLNNEQWQALIALHRTLLNEHHSFFLASQHSSASPALRRLAIKYAMPARMWRHGIHSFLELLRYQLPASLEHMLTFIYTAYSMMALLYETVPTFEDTWIECLEDLGRYRMASEDDDLKDREVWTSVSRHWYSKAGDKAPTTGRLYHHLSVLARPNIVQQLFYCTKPLCVPIPLLSARESIMTHFEPHLRRKFSRLAEIDAAFVRNHGILFCGRSGRENVMDTAGSDLVDDFITSLHVHVDEAARHWMESGYHSGIRLPWCLLPYGARYRSYVRIGDSDILLSHRKHIGHSRHSDHSDAVHASSAIVLSPGLYCLTRAIDFPFSEVEAFAHSMSSVIAMDHRRWNLDIVSQTRQTRQTHESWSRKMLPGISEILGWWRSAGLEKYFLEAKCILLTILQRDMDGLLSILLDQANRLRMDLGIQSGEMYHMLLWRGPNYSELEFLVVYKMKTYSQKPQSGRNPSRLGTNEASLALAKQQPQTGGAPLSLSMPRCRIWIETLNEFCRFLPKTSFSSTKMLIGPFSHGYCPRNF